MCLPKRFLSGSCLVLSYSLSQVCSLLKSFRASFTKVLVPLGSVLKLLILYAHLRLFLKMDPLCSCSLSYFLKIQFLQRTWNCFLVYFKQLFCQELNYLRFHLHAQIHQGKNLQLSDCNDLQGRYLHFCKRLESIIFLVNLCFIPT